MLRPADVLRIAAEERIEAHSRELLACVRAGWRLLPGAPDAPAVSKVGGDPDLASGEAWPFNARGIPMSFVAQVDCSRLPAIDEPWKLSTSWEHGGQLVRLFADLIDNPVGPSRAAALTCAPDSPIVRTAPPAIPDPWPPGGAWDDYEPRDLFRRLPETFVRLEPFLTAPQTHPTLCPYGWDPDDPVAEGYSQWAARLRVDGRDDTTAGPPYAVQHLLGAHSSVQDDVRYVGPMSQSEPYWARHFGIPPGAGLSDIDEWAVLLGLHTNDAFNLSIHDNGALQFVAPTPDLATGQLDRLICAEESG